MKSVAVILAGGQGTRFFPLSNEEHPKQFQDLLGEGPLITQTFERVLPLFAPEQVYVSSNRKYRTKLLEHLPRLAAEHCICEPVGRNTAPALGLLSLIVAREDPSTVVVSLHSDHVIRKESRFLMVLKRAVEVASAGRIVTLGIQPGYAETGYGYIQATKEALPLTSPVAVHGVEAFHEKPDEETAREYLLEENYYWNAGLFIFQAGTMLEQMKQHSPELYEGLMRLEPYLDDLDGPEFQEIYASLPSIPIDIAVMEKSELLVVIPCDIGWCDIGSYLAIFELGVKDAQGNVPLDVQGPLFTEGASSNLIFQKNPGKETGLVCIKDLMIVDTPDYLLVGSLQNSQSVQKLVNRKHSNLESSPQDTDKK
jgi:mannose-1-phosphate guanylyltransferase